MSDRLAELRVAAWTVVSTFRPERCIACDREIAVASRALRTRVDIFRCYPACREWQEGER